MGAQRKTSGILGRMNAAMFKPLAYGYANARVRAMRSMLVQNAMLRQMLSISTTDEAIELLERTTYKEDLVGMSLKFRGEELVELALSANFSRFAKKLRKITPKSGKMVIEALLARWEARNLKAVVLGRKLGRKYEDIAPYIIDIGMIGMEEMRHLMEAPDAESAYARLRATEFGRMLFEGHVEEWMSAGQLRRLMLGLGNDAASGALVEMFDAYYFYIAQSAMLRSDPENGAVSGMLDDEANSKNIATLLRLKKSGAAPDAIMKTIVPGSKARRFWQELAEMEGVDAIVAKIGKKFALHDAYEQYKKDGQVSHFEIALEQRAAIKCLKALYRQQMGIGTIVGALLLKEQEMNNIRKIVRGKALGLPSDRISGMLVMVE